MLLDASMSDADGIDALPATLTLSPRTKVAVFTGFAAPGFESYMRERGAADFIEKSFPLGQLADRLIGLFEAPQHQADRVIQPATGGRTGLKVAPAPPSHDVPNGDPRAVLSEQVSRFREFFDRAEIGMATLTSAGRIVRANHVLAALMHCEPSDLVGVDYGGLVSGQRDLFDHRLGDVAFLGAEVSTFEHDLPRSSPEAEQRLAQVTLVPIRDSHRRLRSMNDVASMGREDPDGSGKDRDRLGHRGGELAGVPERFIHVG